jgi:hypothetical protein
MYGHRYFLTVLAFANFYRFQRFIPQPLALTSYLLKSTLLSYKWLVIHQKPQVFSITYKLNGKISMHSCPSFSIGRFYRRLWMMLRWSIDRNLPTAQLDGWQGRIVR